MELRIVCKSKIVDAVVSDIRPMDYKGSITIDKNLLKEANIHKGEVLQILNMQTGARFFSYAIEGKEGEICINGPAARLIQKQDRLIIISFKIIESKELKDFKYKVIYLNQNNKIEKIEFY